MVYGINSRITRFSLPADPSASSILRRFIRDIASSTNLNSEEIHRLQTAATKAFCSTIAEQNHAEEGRVTLKIDSSADKIVVDLRYREVHFPPEELVSRS